MRSLILGFILAVSLALPRVQAQTHVEFNTTLGPLLVELYDTEKPQTVQNFLGLVANPAFSELFFHIWGPGSSLSGGEFALYSNWATNPVYTNSSYPVLNFNASITNEIHVGKFFSNTFGTIAKDNLTTNITRPTFFINLTNNTHLDTLFGGYNVFGKVIGNTNLLGLFNFAPGTHGIWVTNYYGSGKPGPFFAFPSLFEGSLAPKNLIFIHPHVVNPTIRASYNRGTSSVNFNTLSNYTHVVEVATNLPPDWKLVTFTLGTGTPMSIPDNNTNDPVRIYRVRIE